MHAKTDSEVTSLALSSPARSPPRAVTNNANAGSGGGVMRGAAYYVQSPSRDSHDGETTTKGATSVHSTPALSPMASPRHSHSSVGRDSSSSRFSRGHAHHQDKSAGRKGAPPGKGWQEIGVIEEEDQRRPMPKRCNSTTTIPCRAVLANRRRRPPCIARTRSCAGLSIIGGIWFSF